ncbi:UNVERIFIED_CONTAM: hypothetical protein GTU68_019551 [Idotea baltica]|nr:hypothetical protein [Idotea baltica]
MTWDGTMWVIMVHLSRPRISIDWLMKG